MGTDIMGMVEVRYSYTSWRDVLNAGDILVRNYDLFGMLFGIRNSTELQPVAADRGLPSDVSTGVRLVGEDPYSDFFSWTWISYPEIKSINLDEELPEVNDLVHEFDRTEDGTWSYSGECSRSAFDDNGMLEEMGGEYVKGDKMYKKVKLKRRDCLDSCWALLVRLMDVLAEHYGPENVRLVVWFWN